MARIDNLHTRVAGLLADWFELDEVVRDEDGDYPFRHGTAALWVQVLDRDPPVLRVFSVAAHDVPAGPDLLAELNDINAGISFVRVSFTDGRVWVEQEMYLEAVDAFAVGMACERVGELADRIGPPLCALYGGSTRYRMVDPEGDGPQPAGDGSQPRG